MQVLEELAGLPPADLRQVVEDNPVLVQMVDLAWEEAARTASEDKRRLLAKVVAAALRGDAAAEVDELQFLLRTVMAFDPAHVTLLVIMATPHDPGRPGEIRLEELRWRWSSAEDLLDPALAALEREGLIAGAAGIVYGERRQWTLGPFGRRFFNFLVRSDEAEHFQTG